MLSSRKAKGRAGLDASAAPAGAVAADEPSSPRVAWRAASIRLGCSTKPAVRIAEMVRHGQFCQDLARSHVQALNTPMSGAVVDAHGREGLIALGRIHAALIALGL